jgi:hypothetical protein
MVLTLMLMAATIAAGWLYLREQRSARLRAQFGPEYERVVTAGGSRRSGETELERRRERVQKLNIVPLSREDAEAFKARWEWVQGHFVDEPGEAIQHAHALVKEVMQTRGYPMRDFEQRAADISVDHPQVVKDYRAARTISMAQERGEASTEELRRAMLHYRTLFGDLLETRERERRRRVA